MRLVPALALATLLAAAPAYAQDATTPAAPAEAAPAAPAEPAPTPTPVPPPDVATIGPNADRDFWCALAYSLTARAAQIGGDEATTMAEATKSQVLFAGLVTTMKAGSYGEAEFNALTGQYTIAVLDPFATPKYTREQCEAAVPEAKAIVDAAAPAVDGPSAARRSAATVAARSSRPPCGCSSTRRAVGPLA
jgi:hypothetical protein